MVTPTITPQASRTDLTQLPDRTANTGNIRGATQAGGVSPSQSLHVETAVTPHAAASEATRPTDVERGEPVRTVVQRFMHNRTNALRREINAEKLATTLNQYRSHPQAPGFDHSKSIGWHNKHVPYAAHRDLADSVSVPAAEFHASEVAAAFAGAQVPLGTIAWSGLLGYEIVPHATAAASPWAAAGATLGAATLIAPGSAVTQPFVVPFQEGPRGQAAPSVKGKPKVPETKSTVASALKTSAGSAKSHTVQFENELKAWSQAHEMGPIPTDPHAQVEHLTDLYARLEPAQRERWAELAGIRDSDRKELFELREHLAHVTTLTNRESAARFYQGISRFVRGVSAIFNPLMLDKTGLGSEGVTRVATGIAGLAILSQFPAAAADERYGALKSDRVMALQFSDVFNEMGKADWDAGKPVTAAGIDQDKARTNVYRDPVLVRSDVLVKLAERELASLVQEHGTIDSLPEGAVRQRLETFQRDIDNLKSTREEIEEPGADMAQLIARSESPRNLGYVGAQAMQRLQGGDFWVQLSERIAAVISMLALGSGATLAVGRVASAAQGGSTHIPFQRAMGLAGLVGGIALVAAYTVYCSSVIKAHTRDRGDINFFKQTVMGTFAPVILLYGLMQEHGVPFVVEGAMPSLEKAVNRDTELVAQAAQVLSNAINELREASDNNVPRDLEEFGRIIETLSEGGTSPKIFPSSPDVAGVGPSDQRATSRSPELGEPASSVHLSTAEQLQKRA